MFYRESQSSKCRWTLSWSDAVKQNDEEADEMFMSQMINVMQEKSQSLRNTASIPIFYISVHTCAYFRYQRISSLGRHHCFLWELIGWSLKLFDRARNH